MISSKYYKALFIVDDFIGFALVVLILFATVRQCIRIPLSPIFSIAIIASLTLLSFSLIHFNKIIFLFNKLISISYKSKGKIFDVGIINKHKKDDEPGEVVEENEIKASSVSSFEYENQDISPDSSKSELGNTDSFGQTLPPFNFSQKSILRSFSFKADRPFYRYASDTAYLNHTGFVSRDAPIFNAKSLVSQDVVRDVKFFRLYRKIRIWLKLKIVRRLLLSKVWVVSSLLITLSWFAVWEWAALYMRRDDGDYNLLHWNMDSIPYQYWYFESAFQIIFSMTYIMNLYESQFRLKYIFSFFGLIELTMTPLLTEIMLLIAFYHPDIPPERQKSLENFGLLFFGSLRFLRLFQAENLISRSFTWISEFYTVFIGITASIFALVFTFSGLLFLIEAPRHDIQFTSPFDFIFFGIATMATVGYGDFSPITFFGRFLCILFIILCVTIATAQFKRLKLSVNEKALKLGRGKFPDGYVFFWGSLSDWQLLSFCKCIHNTYYNLVSNVVVASPLPLKYYETVHTAVTQNTSIRLIIYAGSRSFFDPSYISKLMFHSKYTILVNDMDFNLSPNFNQYIVNDDRRMILKVLASVNVSRQLGIPLSLQLHGSEYKQLVKHFHFDNVFFNRDLKYKMFAKSVVCKGLFYLISSLFNSPTSINRTKIHVEEMCNLFLLSEKAHQYDEKMHHKEADENKLLLSVYDLSSQMNELFRGMKFQIFKLEFPKSSYGVGFHDFANYLYNDKNIFLIGIVSTRNVCILNPMQYTIGDDTDDVYFGLVIAESLDAVIKVSYAKFNPEEHTFPDLSILPSIKKARSISILPSINESSPALEVVKYRGVYKVRSYSYAKQHVFDEERMVLLCGWPYDLKNFISELLSVRTFNIVILAPQDCVDDEDPQSLEDFANNVVFIDESPMTIKALLNAGIFESECVIVFNSHHTPDKGRRENLSRDCQVLFIHRLAIEATKGDKRFRVNAILDISHASCLEYMDPSLIVNVDVTSKNYAQNKCWENYGEFISSYEIASGSIFVQDMFYSILAHSNSRSEYAVSHESIESLLHPHTLKTSNYTLEGGTITLEKAAISFYGKNFEDLFKYYFIVEKKVCIGILRTYVVPFANAETKEFVIVAPQPYLIIQPGDQIYLITKSRTV